MVPADQSVLYLEKYPVPTALPGNLQNITTYFYVFVSYSTLFLFWDVTAVFWEWFSGTMKATKGQEDGQQPFTLPIWAFSMENSSSLREPTSLDVSTKLAQQFCQDGFITAGSTGPIWIRLEVRIQVVPNTCCTNQIGFY